MIKYIYDKVSRTKQQVLPIKNGLFHKVVVILTARVEIIIFNINGFSF